MKRIIRFFGSKISTVVHTIRKADALFEKYWVYALACLLLVVTISIILGNSFYRTKTFSNYSRSISTSIRLEEGQAVRFSFDAQKDRLSSIIINKDVSKSRLEESDTLEVSIFDENGSLVVKKEVFLYHPHRSYVSLSFSGIKLEDGKQYVCEMKVANLSVKSVLYLKMHAENAFDDSYFDDETNDRAIGFKYVPNISYGYSVISILSMAVHVAFIVSAAILLFFERLRKSRIFCELYRVFFVIVFLYVFTEMLNIARDDSLQFLFPFKLKTIVLMVTALLVVIIVYMLLYFLISHGTIALLLTSILVFILGYVNHSKIVMRGDPLMPWDIYAAGVAAKCSTQYDFRVTVQFVASIFMVAVILLMIRLTHHPRIKSWKLRVLGATIAVVFGAALTFGFIINTELHEKMDISYSLYPPLESFNENGTVLSFFLHLNNIKPKGTVDNSPEQTADIIDKYVQIADQLNLDKQVLYNPVNPNVICIMSESYADLRMIRDFETSEPIMPYYDSIIDETLHGELQVSVFAGGTSNTEFEFMTGYSVSGLLAGSSVYTFYVRDELNAMPKLFRNEGYRTIALHPFDPQWWDRDRAYPILGFDSYISQDDFDDPKMIRRFISDESVFRRIIEEYEKTDQEQPFFAFCVTMQNHADYSVRWDNQKYDIKLESFEELEFPFAENYFSLLRESDDALEVLIEYFRGVKEPTIIVFFGDHLATLDHGFYDLLLDTSINQISAEESIPLYSTPYFIWSNYNLPSGYGGMSSPNFLGQIILNLAGISSPDERACLRVLNEKISAISALAVFDRDGTAWLSPDGMDEEIVEIIKDYEKIQYGEIFFSDEEDIETVS